MTTETIRECEMHSAAHRHGRAASQLILALNAADSVDAAIAAAMAEARYLGAHGVPEMQAFAEAITARRGALAGRVLGGRVTEMGAWVRMAWPAITQLAEAAG
ncbi:hypothetical protein [Tsukamurella soli]|uniref:hypothetical protein n=1 Tax=Tsukamurella soli TaxID=644556 RepID=UPI0031E9AEC8